MVNTRRADRPFVGSCAALVVVMTLAAHWAGAAVSASSVPPTDPVPVTAVDSVDSSTTEASTTTEASISTAAVAAESEATSAPMVIEADVDYAAAAATGFDEPPLLDVWSSDELDSAPVLVVLHGVPGVRSDNAHLSAELAGRGYVVFNTDWQFNIDTPDASSVGSFQVACAVQLARATAARYGGDPDNVVVVGHSAGGNVAAAVSLNGDAFIDQCSNDESLSGRADRLIGLAGAYDACELSQPLGALFFEQDPTLWELCGPYEQLDRADGLSVLLIHGDQDDAIPLSTTERFADELGANGADVTVEVLAGADHRLVFDPWLTPIGDLIDTFLEQG